MDYGASKVSNLSQRFIQRVGNVDDRKIISGRVFFLGRRLIPWTSKKNIYFIIYRRGWVCCYISELFKFHMDQVIIERYKGSYYLLW